MILDLANFLKALADITKQIESLKLKSQQEKPFSDNDLITPGDPEYQENTDSPEPKEEQKEKPKEEQKEIKNIAEGQNPKNEIEFPSQNLQLKEDDKINKEKEDEELSRRQEDDELRRRQEDDKLSRRKEDDEQKQKLLKITKINSLKEETKTDDEKMRRREEDDELRSRREEDDENLEADEKDCAICLERKKNVLFLPCKHVCSCEMCSPNLKSCPICDVEVKERFQVVL